MATVDSQTDSELVLSDWDGSNRSRASRYLDKRLAETSSNYKSVAVATFLLTAAIAGFGWLLFGVLFEHWWITGGMPAWLRWTWLVAGLLGAVVLTFKLLVPVLWYLSLIHI